jgi:hypothetical protein
MIKLYSIKHPALKNAFAIPNGGQRHKAVAAKLKAEGVSPGYPDIALDWPSRDYHGFVLSSKGTARGLACQAIKSSGLQGLVMQAIYVSAAMAGVMRGRLFAGILKLIRNRVRQ